MSTNNALQGYRIVVGFGSAHTVAKYDWWSSSGAYITQAPTDSYEEFTAWWAKEVQLATEDRVALAVVVMRNLISRYDWLKRLEEDPMVWGLQGKRKSEICNISRRIGGNRDKQFDTRYLE